MYSLTILYAVTIILFEYNCPHAVDRARERLNNEVAAAVHLSAASFGATDLSTQFDRTGSLMNSTIQRATAAQTTSERNGVRAV
jgi:hypothetical protein